MGRFFGACAVQGALDGPAEGACCVFVKCFEYEEQGADFEDGGADEGGYTAGIEYLAIEFGFWSKEGKEDEAAELSLGGSAKWSTHEWPYKALMTQTQLPKVKL
jgi:hypothetical protein